MNNSEREVAVAAVIVPTKNSAATLRECLESIRLQTSKCTLVVVDNGSTDLTLKIAQEFADVVLESGPERSAQRNAGAQASTEYVIGFIDSDMTLESRVVEEALNAIQEGAATVVIPEITVGDGYWAKVSAYERSFYDGNDYVEAPRFFTRACFENVGGFDVTMTGAEDWDLGLRTIKAGPRARTTAKIIHNEGHVKFFALCRKKAYYAGGVARFVQKHGFQALRAATNRRWLRNPRVLLQPLGVGIIFLKLGQAIAMTLSLGQSFIVHKVTANKDT